MKDPLIGPSPAPPAPPTRRAASYQKRPPGAKSPAPDAAIPTGPRRKAFSRLDLFEEDLMSAKSRFMARRTSVPGKILIWPVANKTSWRKQRVLPSVSLLRMSLDGKTFVDRTKNVTVFGANAMPSYTGYNWNTPAGENCDGCGRSYTSALNHRSLLYWEILDDGYTAEQWFHASPLSLQASKGPDNSVQDVEFYLREP